VPIIQDVNFHIIRDSYPSGSICQISYRYELLLSVDEYRLANEIGVWVELWGKETLHNKSLGSAGYDAHTVDAKARIEASRTFTVPCKILDEEIGYDEIFLRLCVNSKLGSTVCKDTDIIREHF